MPFLPLFLPRVPEVRGPIPAGLGGDAPLQVEWTPCDLDNPSHRRAHEDTGRAFRQINRAENFPRRGTATALWKPNTTPNTIAIEDNETGEAIVVNMDPEPGRDPNLRDGDTVAYYYEGDTAWTWKSYHDDKVGTLKFWTLDPGDIPAGWGIANDGVGSGTNSVANGGSGLDYVTPGFIVCANTAGTLVAAVNVDPVDNHNHTPGSGIGDNTDALATENADANVANHSSHTHTVTINNHDDHYHTIGDSTTFFATDLGEENVSYVNLTDKQTDGFGDPLVLSHSIDTVSGVILTHTYNGHSHTIENHSHPFTIGDDGAHDHSGGTPAYMTAIPIERIP
jgi:hypothetical protein